MTQPVDFEERSRRAKQASGGGYPVQISASDLMRNFVYAALDADPSLIEQTTGQGGHAGRKLKIDPGTANGQIMQWNGSRWSPFDAPPTTGTHVLGAVGGTLQWLATEEC